MKGEGFEILVVNSRIRKVYEIEKLVTDLRTLNDLRLRGVKFGFKTEQGELFAISPANLFRPAGLLQITDLGIMDKGPAVFILPTARPLNETEKRALAATH